MKEEKEKVDYRKIIEMVKPEMEKALRSFEEELKTIRSGRASPSLVENLEVECFGQKFLMRQLGTISVSQPRELTISPWDPSYIESMLRAIESSGLGLNSLVDKNIIRLVFPPLTQEFRQNLLKVLSQKKEKVKKQIRYLRQEAWDEIQKYFLEKKLSEDEKYRGKEELQELVDDYNEKIEEISKKKEEEIKG